MAKSLTTSRIEQTIKPDAVRREYPDGLLAGLYLIVQPSGAKSWAVRYRHAGRPAKMTLGPYPAVTLAKARELGRDAIITAKQGRDPGAEKKAALRKTEQAAANTLEAIAEEYLTRECGMGRDAEGNATFNGKLPSGASRLGVLERLGAVRGRGRLRHRFGGPALGDRPIAEIERDEIIRLLDRIEDEKGPVAADMGLAVLRRVMTWHASRSNFRSPIVPGMTRTKPKERARKRSLTDDEIRVIWKIAGEFPGPFGALVKFLMLTLARRCEAARMGRNEVASNFDWTLPAARNKKTKVDLVRPLSNAARTVFAGLPQIDDCDFVFTTNGKAPISGFSKFKLEFDKSVLEELQKQDAKAKPLPNWRLHDLRRTGRSLMSRAGVPSDHAELCLGHVIGGVRETYDRWEYHDEKAQAFEALAVLIERIVDPQDNIILVRGRR
jgi:integrase